MKIHGLLPFLRKFVKNMNLRELAGQTAAIDASCWLDADVVTHVVTSRDDYVRNVLWLEEMSTPSRWRGNVVVIKCCFLEMSLYSVSND